MERLFSSTLSLSTEQIQSHPASNKQIHDFFNSLPDFTAFVLDPTIGIFLFVFRESSFSLYSLVSLLNSLQQKVIEVSTLSGCVICSVNSDIELDNSTLDLVTGIH